MSKVAGVPKKVKQAIQSKKAAGCSAASCSAPASSCSAPQVPQAPEAPQPVAVYEPETVVLVSAPVFSASDCTIGQCTVDESARSFQPIRAAVASLAQSKAEIQARNGRMQHLGGSFGNGRFEGVGFSTVSADHAIQQCCYWGQKTPVDIGVAQGTNGWYATVLYR